MDPDSGGGGIYDEIVIDLSGASADDFVDTEGPRTLKQLVKAFRDTARWDGIKAKGLGHFHRDPTYRIAGRVRTHVRVLRAEPAQP